MSRTNTSSYLKGKGRDGRNDWKTIIVRDSHVTGLRDQKRDRPYSQGHPQNRRGNSPIRETPKVQQQLRNLRVLNLTPSRNKHQSP